MVADAGFQLASPFPVQFNCPFKLVGLNWIAEPESCMTPVQNQVNPPELVTEGVNDASEPVHPPEYWITL